MKKCAGAEPDRISYSILIDHLMREKNFAEARDLLDEMKSIQNETH